MIEFETDIKALDYLNYWFVEITPDILAQLPGRKEKGDFNQRLLVTLDSKVRWQAGILALGEGSGLITVQKDRLKKLGKTLGDFVTVQLEKDESEFGVPLPEEIKEYWIQVPESKDRFDALTPGMKRYILNHISTAKSIEKRLERTHSLMTNLLLAPQGKETFRFLLGKD
ncbi:YdeI/OmpD-associated family protein [Fluviicola sp.]|uniref:YdeI/OmpD-associated family protein n=1 Tax=Fluviicola sp. TaxID=1917219 RepID=UPI0031DA7E8B